METHLECSKEERRNILLLDIEQGIVSFQVCKDAEEIDFEEAEETKKYPRLLKTFGDPQIVLLSILNSIAQESRLNETVIYLGCNSDPFENSETNYSFVFQAIETLLNNSPCRLIIQTSSILVFLALPLLINYKNKVRLNTKKEYLEKLNKLWSS